jgi:hypothetical protein
LKKYKGQLQIGSLEGKAPAPAPAPAPEPKKEVVEAKAVALKPGPAAAVAAETELKESLEPFGDLIPFGDPAWYQGVRTMILRMHGLRLT